MVAVVSVFGKLFRLGILNNAFGKKRYFLPLGTTPKTGVGFIAKKITGPLPKIAKKIPARYILLKGDGRTDGQMDGWNDGKPCPSAFLRKGGGQ